MALEALHHFIRVNDQVGQFGEDEPIGLDLGGKIAGEAGHVFQTHQQVAGEGLDAGVGGEERCIGRAKGVLKLEIYVGGQQPFT